MRSSRAAGSSSARSPRSAPTASTPPSATRRATTSAWSSRRPEALGDGLGGRGRRAVLRFEVHAGAEQLRRGRRPPVALLVARQCGGDLVEPRAEGEGYGVGHAAAAETPVGQLDVEDADLGGIVAGGNLAELACGEGHSALLSVVIGRPARLLGAAQARLGALHGPLELTQPRHPRRPRAVHLRLVEVVAVAVVTGL